MYYGKDSLNGQPPLPSVSQLHKGDADHLKLSKYQVWPADDRLMPHPCALAHAPRALSPQELPRALQFSGQGLFIDSCPLPC